MNNTPFQPVLPGTPDPVEIPGPVEPDGETPRRQGSETHRMLSTWVPNETHAAVIRKAAAANMTVSAYLEKRLSYDMTRKHGNNKRG